MIIERQVALKSTIKYGACMMYSVNQAEASILGAGGQLPPMKILGGKHIVLPPPPFNNFDNLKNSQCVMQE